MRYPLPISWHVQDWTDNRVGTYVRRVLPAFNAVAFPFWIKGLDPPEQAPDWATLPGVYVLGRMFEDDAVSWADMARGKDGAQDFFNRHIDKWLARQWVACWTTGNEPHPPGDHEFLRALNEFMVEIARLMHAAGLQCGGPNLSVGWLDIGDTPLLGPGMCAMDRLVLHEYSAPAMWTTEPYHVGRWEIAIQELVDAGYSNIPPILIGETGIDGGVKPVYQGGTGWRTWADGEDEYVQQLAWAAKKHLDHLGRVESAFIFTVCQPGWGWDDFTPTDALFEKLADAVIAGYEVDEPPLPIEPPDFAVIDVVDDLPVNPDPDNVYDDRFESEISGIVIHHSGYTYPADATEDQVRAHLQVIANYHITQNDWPGIAYHFVVDGAGRVWQTQDIWTVSYHCGTRNEDTIGVCMLGAFHLETDPTPAQLRAVNCLCQWLQLDIERSLEIIPHKAIVATACPGKISRWWDQITEPCDDCFEEEPEEPEEPGGDVDELQIIDRNGVDLGITVEQLEEDYGVRIIRADPGTDAKVWRVRRLILDSTAETNMRLYARDAAGMAISRAVPFLGVQPDSGTVLPDDAAPRISPTYWAQPEGKPNRALQHAELDLNFTNSDGYIQHSLGPGSNMVLPGPGTHWAWMMPGDDANYSDVCLNLGMWENHLLWWVEFWLEEPGDDGGELPPVVEPGDYVAHVPEIKVTITIPAFDVPITPVE